MELRGCSHVHFIQAIKGALVEKILNVDSQGRPAFRFKTIKAIYESEDATNLGSCSTVQQQEGGFMGSPLGCGRVNIDRTFIPMGGSAIKSDPDVCELNQDDGDNIRNSAWDDLCFSEMTLKQLMNRSKTKKRKLPKYVELAEVTKQDSCSNLNQDCDNMQQKEDEPDLEETLSSWKLKLSNKSKAKRKCIRKEVCSSSKIEQILSAPQDSLLNTGELNEPSNIKIEISEPDSSDCHNVVCFSDGSTSDYHAEMDFRGELSDEVPERVKGSELEAGELTSFTKESSSCVVNEVSTDYLDDGDPISLLLSATVGVGEATNSSFSEMTSQESLPSPVTECSEDVNIIHSLPSVSPLEAICVPKEPGSGTYGNSESCSFLEMELSCEMDGNSVIQVPDMVNDNALRCMETNCDSDGYMLDMEDQGESKEVTPPDSEINVISNSDVFFISSQNSYPCLKPPSLFSSVDYNSPTTEEIHSPLMTEGPCSSGVDRGSIGTDHSAATNGLPAMNMLENHCSLKLECPPKRLLSTRKAISPTSQEKLCQAADADDLLDDKEPSKCRERLCFVEQTKNKASSAGSGLDGDEVTISPERIIMQPRNDKNGPALSVTKGILKAPYVSCTIPRAGTECTPIHTCAENAIAFSRRQMHDIECLAMKLMKGLKSMKCIVEETLHSEAYPSTSSKYSVDEVRMAVDNAAVLEETTRKWLSMMARDCSRFCKIMRSTEKKAAAAAASSYGLNKDRKKITFADEAGGMLCHVKVFEDQPALPSSECENEKPQAY